MTEPQQQPQSSDDSSGESRHVAAQPQYGQRIEPEYGARADEFPPNYNPYVYGGQPEQPAPQTQPSPSQPASVFGAGPAPAQGGSAPNAAPAQGGPDQGGPRREPPRYFNGIDLNDPQQNPIYGHWDFYAIFSFIFALVSSFPVLPALIGCLAIWRTRRFHTRGRGLAIAAVVINVLTTMHRHMDDDAWHIDGRHVPGHAQHAGARHGRKRVGGLRFGVMGRVLRHASR